MRRIVMLLVVTGVGVAGAASAHDTRHPRGCSAIEVTAPGLKKQPRDGRFSTRKVLDLEFVTRLERPTYGEHVMHFKVFTPSGFLYQELDVPFVWPRPRRGHKYPQDEAQPTPVSVSYPKGMPVQVLGDGAPRGRRRDSVEARLPVAGTSITMSTLYGRWTVQAFLDDGTRPCSQLRSFTLHGK